MKYPSIVDNKIILLYTTVFVFMVHQICHKRPGYRFCIPSEHAIIQVCLQLNDQSSDREIDNLIKASAYLSDLERLIIVTYDESVLNDPDLSKIEVLPIDVFLLKGLGSKFR